MKKNATTFTMGGGEYDSVSFAEDPAVRKRQGGARFSDKEAFAPPCSVKKCDAKVRALVGNAPLKHDTTNRMINIPASRANALTACFGSSGMSESLFGANKRQIRNPPSDKPCDRSIGDIRSTH